MGKNKGLNIILSTLLIGVIAALGTFYFIKDEYNAMSNIEIASTESQEDLLTAMKSNQIREKVINDNNLSVPNSTLEKAVVINNKNENLHYQLNVSYNNKQDSIDLTDMYAKALEEELHNIAKVDSVKVLSLAKDKNVNKTSTLLRILYIGAGLLIGALLGFLINAIRSPKSKKREPSERQNTLAKYPVLGTIRIY